MSTPAPAHVQRVLMLAAVTNELLKRAQAQNQEKSASVTKVTELSKKAAQLLADNARINSDQVEKVASALCSHEKALQLLGELAIHRTGPELGRPAKGEKSASVQTPAATNRTVGERVTNYDSTAHGASFRNAMLGG